MPRRDGTGPVGMGPMTGRGKGSCNLNENISSLRGLGIGCRRGLKKDRFNNINSANIKDLLNEEKTILENRLKLINSQLNTSEDDK